MSEHDAFDRVLAAVHAATLDETRWPATSALIDEALLAGSHIGWGLNDPVDAEGWGASRITMVERLLPHIQQFVRVRQVLAGAGALGASLADLLAATGLGIIQLDGRGRIAAGRTTEPWPCCAPARAWSTRVGFWARTSRRTTPCCRAC